MAELYPVIPGTVVEDCIGYWGPNHTRYTSDTDSVLTVGQQVDVLWQEGSYYYVRFTTGGVKKRSCFEAACIQIPDGVTVTPHTPPAVPGCFRSITGNTKVYNILASDNPEDYEEQGDVPHIGSINYKETVRYLGLTIDGYALVEYDIIDYDMVDDDDTDNINEGNDKRKRGWVDASKLGAMPNPTGTVYASTRGGIPVSQQDANARFIYDYLRAYGFNHNSACGVLGNIFQECSMNPAKWQIIDNTDVPDITYGYGIFQWDDATNYLRRAVTLGMIPLMTAAAIDNFVNASDANKKALMLSQIEFMLAGCFAGFQWGDPDEWDYAHHVPIEGEFTILDFMSSDMSAEDLAVVFCDYFERPLNPQMKVRSDKAGYYDDLFA